MKRIRHKITRFVRYIMRIDDQTFKGLIMVLSIIVLVVFLKVGVNKMDTYEKQRLQVINDINTEQLASDFNFLFNAGNSQLKRNNIKKAYYEFTLAYKITPNHKELNTLLIQTLSVLCKENNKYCKELDSYLDMEMN